MFSPEEIDDARIGLYRAIRHRLHQRRWFQGGLQGVAAEISDAIGERSAERLTQERFHDYFGRIVPQSDFLLPKTPIRYPE